MLEGVVGGSPSLALAAPAPDNVSPVPGHGLHWRLSVSRSLLLPAGFGSVSLSPSIVGALVGTVPTAAMPFLRDSEQNVTGNDRRKPLCVPTCRL